MLNIYLARHGQDEDNEKGILNGHRDNNLTSLGVKQAEELSKDIEALNLNFDYIYSSPLKRAFKTAQIVAGDKFSGEIEILDGLIERDFGVMTGKHFSDIKPMCSPDIIEAENISYFLSPEGAETFPELMKRGAEVLDYIRSEHRDGNILLVTSGDIGKMIYATYYNLDWKQVLMLFHFGNSDLLILSENSLPNEAHVLKYKQHNK